MEAHGPITFATAGAAIDLAALGLIGLALFAVLSRRISTSILLLAGQGLLLGFASGAAALAEMEWRSWAAFAMAVGVKMVAIPMMLWFVLTRMAIKQELETVVSVKLAFPIAVAMVPLSYRAIEPITDSVSGGFDAPNAFPSAMTLLLLGLLTMVIRRKAISQVIALVTMENGLYLAAVAATRGLPFAVEFGVAVDVVVGVAVMALMLRQIIFTLGTLNTDLMRTLRG